MGSRRKKGSLRKWVEDLLLDVPRSIVSGGLLSFLLPIFGVEGVVLPMLGGLVFAAGVTYCGCVFLQDPAPHGLHASEKRLGALCVFVGLLLTLLGSLGQPPILVALIGGGACFALYRRGHVLKDLRDRLARGRQWRVGRNRAIKAPLTLPLLVILYAGFGFAGVGSAELYQAAPPPNGEVEKSETDPPLEARSAPRSKRRFSYAELCKKLPDPQQIGYGLGDLFEHDGAVAAGCGEPALRVGETTWVSPGFCSGELRSLGVVGEGREPVLLYGSPARFAWDKAQNRDLRFAEASELAGGEVALIGVDNGTLAFARSSPALKPGHGDAVRCEEVDEVARPFIELQAPLTRLWQELLEIENEWIWPEAGERVGEVIFQGSDGLPVYGSCESAVVCRLDGPDLHRIAEGPADISIDQLGVYAAGVDE
jgi:hypothetical protein